MQGLSCEIYQDKECIDIENKILKLWKSSRLYKDYSSSFYNVWLEDFINYTFILISLFETSAPYFLVSLTQFYDIVLQFSKVYDWKEALLPLVIEVQSYIIT